MIRLCRCWQSMHARLVSLLVATTCLGAPTTLGGGQAQESPHKDPWSVYSWGLNSHDIYYPPSCHQLSYFSRSPLRFDRRGELATWKPGSFTVHSWVNLLGTIHRRRIYQVLQYLQPRSAPAEGEEYKEFGMKRLVVERHPNEFCMIFEEQGTLGPFADLVRIEPAEFTTIDGEPVLLTHDLIPGTGGYTVDGAWTFDHGVPVSLLSPSNDAILHALKEILPPGCWIRPNRNPLDLENFRYLAEVWPTKDGNEESTCDGGVELKLGVKDHRLVVVDKRYK